MTGDDSGPSDMPQNAWLTKEYVNNNYVPIEELEALAEQWESKEPSDEWYASHQFETLEHCVQELREVIEQYE